MDFPPLRVTLADALTRSLLSLIGEEHLQAGDRLPSQRELSQRYRVAIPTLREAIKRLEAFGVVEVRHGSGIFVRVAEPTLMLANPTAPRVTEQSILDLLDTRLLFEPHCAEIAAHDAMNPMVQELSLILTRAAAELERDDHALQTANMEFHIGIVRCSRNSVLIQVMILLTDIYSSEQSLMLTLGNNRRQDHEQHLAILDAIQRHAPQEASSLMRDHLQSVKTMLINRFAAVANDERPV